MKKIIFVSILLCVLPATASITELLHKSAPHTNIGIKIKDLENNQVIYEQNAEHLFNFASSVKFINFATLSKYFGFDYKFTSQIIRSGTDYYLDIGDNPNFNNLILKELLQQAKKNGMREIKGNFYIIERQWTVPSTNPARMVEDTQYCYGAHVSRTHINQNCFKLYAEAGKSIGLKNKITSQDKGIYQIINLSKTIKPSQKARILRQIDGDKITISGSLHPNSGSLFISPVTQDNITHLKLFMRKYLKNLGIKYHGQLTTTTITPKGKILATYSENFQTIAAKALKESDNFISDYLFVKFAEKHNCDEWQDISALFAKFIKQTYGVNLDNAAMIDGSGLSRHNRFTPNHFDQLLSAIYKDEIFATFKEMLAIPGEFGSLEKRFKAVKIYAKTGSMTGTSAIVGYIYDQNNHPYSFVIVANNFLASQNTFKLLEETILKTALKL